IVKNCRTHELPRVCVAVLLAQKASENAEPDHPTPSQNQSALEPYRPALDPARQPNHDQACCTQGQRHKHDGKVSVHPMKNLQGMRREKKKCLTVDEASALPKQSPPPP